MTAPRALTHEHDGQTVHFCSEHCFQAFEVSSGKYVDGAGTPIEARGVGHDGGHGPRYPRRDAERGTDEDRRHVPDPVCGMAVDPASALSAEHDGRAFYLCSQGCRERFAAEPVRYVNEPGASVETRD